MITQADPVRLQRLKEQFGFAAWRERKRLDRHLLIAGFRFSGSEVPGWAPQRVRRTPLPYGLTRIRSFWVPTAAGLPATPMSGVQAMPIGGSMAPARLAGVSLPFLDSDVFECSSLRAAHENLVSLLGEFELAGMRLEEGSSTGDVAFTGGALVMAFARANLVVLLRNVGRSAAPLREVADQLDRELVRDPGEGGFVMAAEAPRARAIPLAVRPGGEVILPLSEPLQQGLRSSLAATAAPAVTSGAAAAAGFGAPQPHWFKVFSRSGEVVRDGDQFIYRAGTGGQDEITLFAMDPAGRATRHRWRVNVTREERTGNDR
jgi:hypothetical protein